MRRIFLLLLAIFCSSNGKLFINNAVDRIDDFSLPSDPGSSLSTSNKLLSLLDRNNVEKYEHQKQDNNVLNRKLLRHKSKSKGKMGKSKKGNVRKGGEDAEFKKGWKSPRREDNREGKREHGINGNRNSKRNNKDKNEKNTSHRNDKTLEDNATEENNSKTKGGDKKDVANKLKRLKTKILEVLKRDKYDATFNMKNQVVISTLPNEDLNQLDLVSKKTMDLPASPNRIFMIEVQNGHGQGYYQSKERVEITADVCLDESSFSHWIIISGNVGIDDIYSQSTMVTVLKGDATVKAICEILLHELTVVDGAGSGFYKAGAEVIITAKEPPTSKNFMKWSLIPASNDIIINVQSQTSKLIMPSHDIMVEASYIDKPKNPTTSPPGTLHELVVVEGTGSGFYEVGADVIIEATKPLKSQKWMNWIPSRGHNDMIADVTSLSTILTMPSYNLTVQASYGDKCMVDAETRRNGITHIIEEMYDRAYWDNQMSPQTLVTEWLIEEDEFYVCPREESKVRQRYILGALYLSTKGDKWNRCFAGDDECGRQSSSVFFRKKAYLSSYDECEWAGTTCDGKIITSLEFENGNNMVGTLPMEMGFLKALEKVSMEGQNIGGTLPSYFRQMRRLREINLGSNALSGVLPIELYSLTSLESLNLHSNNLSGTINERITKMSSLKYLYLQDNNFDGGFPRSLALVPLVEANFQSNSFFGEMPLCVGSRTQTIKAIYSDCGHDSAPVICRPECGCSCTTEFAAKSLTLSHTKDPTNSIIGSRTSTKVPTNHHTKYTSISPTKFVTQTSTKSTTISPTKSPIQLPQSYDDECIMNAEDRRAGIIRIIEGIYGAAFSAKKMSAQSMAAEWLIEDDELHVCPDEESRVKRRFLLSVIYFATKGDEWIRCFAGDAECGRASNSVFFGKSAYLSSVNECEWAGSICNKNIFTALEFESKNNMAGTLPMEIGFLNTLERISLKGQKIGGTLPANFRMLNQLKEMSLGSNELSGSIPKELYSLSSLVTLDLQSNNFSGNIIDRIVRMTSLKYLELQNNNFDGGFPKGLALIPLVEADFRYNKFSGEMPLCVGAVRQTIEVILNDCGDENATVTCGSSCSCTCSNKAPAKLSSAPTSSPTNSRTNSLTMFPTVVEPIPGSTSGTRSQTIPPTVLSSASASIDETENTNKVSNEILDKYLTVVKPFPNSEWIPSVPARDSSSSDISHATPELGNGEGTIDKYVSYMIAVQDGHGGGYYSANEKIQITGKACPAYLGFRGWMIISGNPEIDDIKSRVTILTVSDSDAIVRATCGIKLYQLTVEDGSGGGFFEAGTVVEIKTRKPTRIEEWKSWTLDIFSGNIKNMFGDIESQITTVKMPAYDVTAKAIFLNKCDTNGGERREGIMNILKYTYGGELPGNKTSAPSKAAEWLISVDENYVCDNKAVALKQRFSLSVLYFSMGGSNWNKCFAGDLDCGNKSEEGAFFGKSAFLSPSNVCEWAGTSCDKKERITALEFEEENNMAGTLPMEIGFLKKLETIFFEGQKIGGTIPASFGQLRNLKEINLASNQLFGSIPDQLYSLSSLKVLDLDNNNLSGTLGSKIGKMTSLKELQLQSNHFYGTFPAALTTIPLVEAEFQFNNFSGELPLCVNRRSKTIKSVSSDCGAFSGASVYCGEKCDCNCY